MQKILTTKERKWKRKKIYNTENTHKKTHPWRYIRTIEEKNHTSEGDKQHKSMTMVNVLYVLLRAWRDILFPFTKKLIFPIFV